MVAMLESVEWLSMTVKCNKLPLITTKLATNCHDKIPLNLLNFHLTIAIAAAKL